MRETEAQNSDMTPPTPGGCYWGEDKGLVSVLHSVQRQKRFHCAELRALIPNTCCLLQSQNCFFPPTPLSGDVLPALFSDSPAHCHLLVRSWSSNQSTSFLAWTSEDSAPQRAHSLLSWKDISLLHGEKELDRQRLESEETPPEITEEGSYQEVTRRDNSSPVPAGWRKHTDPVSPRVLAGAACHSQGTRAAPALGAEVARPWFFVTSETLLLFNPTI